MRGGSSRISFEGNAMAVKINAQVTGYGPQPANTQVLVCHSRI